MDAMEKKQLAQLAVYANIAMQHRRFMEAQQGNSKTPDEKSRIAMEIALANSTRANPAPSPRDVMEGKELLAKAYGRKADDLAVGLSGRVAQFDFPKGANRTEDYAKLVKQGQDMAGNATMAAYQERNSFRATGPNGNYLAHDNPAQTEAKEKLVRHMLAIRTAVEAQVERKQLDRVQGGLVLQRIEKEVFTRETPGVKQDFKDFEKRHTETLRRGVMNEVENRYEAQHGVQKKAAEAEAGQAEKAANREKAQDFLTMKREDAIKKHPDLVNAYAVVQAAATVAQQKFKTQEDQEKFTGQMRDRVSQHIAAGRPIPEVGIKQQQETRRDAAMER